ncbi:Ig-like domain-containing protein [Actinomadura madurae]|uniref:Ig-like domain-containing protein n=1 Tax=Actinomadura madurae TaxID=1993 RepID=UPI002025F316|nr:Ig-like domain-containing protein [Actinomadura madurae]URM97969.1 Ig-like domain-containing protein [Actinomadura madurae]URN08659.1 Ig-like domain-containing protein [Actinomadura madurae]
MRTKILMAGIAAAVLGLSACGGSPETGPEAAGGGGGGPSVTIEAPAAGADVRAPVTLEFSSSEEIGPEESGQDHVHVIIDGKTDDYTVVTSSPYQIKDLPAGRHTIGVTLQHADHSSAGASAEVEVNVTSGGSGGGGSGGGGVYDY